MAGFGLAWYAPRPMNSPRVGYIYVPAFLDHLTGEGHPECPQRLTAIHSELESSGVLARLTRLDPAPATRDQLALVHEPTMIDRIEALSAQGGGSLDEDTAASPGSLKAALLAAGAGITAVEALYAGVIDRAFLALRPPGHHATGQRSMGFCLFNNVAVAAAHALTHKGAKRVAILDWDLHHGNGTEAIFAAEPRVQYLSSHQHPLYPGTGMESDTGVGNIVNAPLPLRAGSAVFRDAWRARLLPALEAFRPQLVLVSAGFDGHRLDPLADLELTAEDYRWLSAELADVASRHCGGRLVSVLEGGYSLTALRECSVAHLRGLTAA